MNNNLKSIVPLPIPSYVLLNEKTRISPKVEPLQSGKNCVALYGFSDKVPYDLFRANSPLLLTPFPLVKGYLNTLIEADSEELHFIVIDARGPSEPQVNATTMQAVLEALKSQAKTVVAEYTLAYDEKSNTYMVLELQ